MWPRAQSIWQHHPRHNQTEWLPGSIVHTDACRGYVTDCDHLWLSATWQCCWKLNWNKLIFFLIPYFLCNLNWQANNKHNFLICTGIPSVTFLDVRCHLWCLQCVFVFSCIVSFCSIFLFGSVVSVCTACVVKLVNVFWTCQSFGLFVCVSSNRSALSSFVHFNSCPNLKIVAPSI